MDNDKYSNLFNLVSSTFLPCARRAFKTGIVCVCNETYCDTLEFEYPKESGEVFILSTTKNGLRYDQSKVSFGGDRQRLRDATNQTSFLSAFSFKQEIYINRNTTFQKIIGFGNAFTGAVLHNLNSVPTLKENIYKSHFSKTSGNGLNMMRIPIGGCDFDLEPWAYNELPENDFKLSNFTQLDPRDLERITEIKNLMNVADVSDLKFVGAAWSSPKWMKTNNAWTGFSALKSEYYQTYADYHVKYLELMHESGIDYWAVSTGNEPLNGVSAFLFIKFMSLGWLPNSQGKWVSDNLGPSLKNHQVLSTVKILTGDDQRYTLPIWFDQMYANHPKSKDFVDGHAVHWYWDKLVNANVLDETHQKYPDKLMLVTEACSGDKPWEVHGPVLGYWPRCEDYILDIIENLSHNVQAWIDWNMILDETGGPNYVSNFVDAPIIVNTTSS